MGVVDDDQKVIKEYNDQGAAGTSPAWESRRKQWRNRQRDGCANRSRASRLRVVGAMPWRAIRARCVARTPRRSRHRVFLTHVLIELLLRIEMRTAYAAVKFVGVCHGLLLLGLAHALAEMRPSACPSTGTGVQATCPRLHSSPRVRRSEMIGSPTRRIQPPVCELVGRRLDLHRVSGVPPRLDRDDIRRVIAIRGCRRQERGTLPVARYERRRECRTRA